VVQAELKTVVPARGFETWTLGLKVLGKAGQSVQGGRFGTQPLLNCPPDQVRCRGGL